MCHHKRIVYSCGHFRWAEEVRACELQKAFEDSTWPKPCLTMLSHPFHTLRVENLCRGCELGKRKRKMAGTMTKLKQAMRELNETVQRLRKATRNEEEGEENQDEKVRGKITEG